MKKALKMFLLPSSLVTRVMVVFLLPVIAIIYLSAQNILQQREILKDAQFTVALVELSPSINFLVQELQRERGLSSGYTGAPEGNFRPSLIAQRQKTDTAIALFNTQSSTFLQGHYDLAMSQIFTKVKSQLKLLPMQRGKIDFYSLPLNDIVRDYSNIISDLLSVQGSMGLAISNSEIGAQAKALGHLQLAKEQAGLERAMGSVGFGNGSFAPDVQTLFTQLGALQTSNLESFHSLAEPQFLDRLADIERSNITQQINALRTEVYKTPANSALSASIDGVQWFALATQRIDMLHRLETAQGEHIGAMSKQLAADVAQNARLSLGLILALIILTTLAALRLKQNVLAPMEDLNQAIVRLVHYETVSAVPHVNRIDTIGGVAKSVDALRRTVISHLQLLEEDKMRKRSLEADLPSHQLF